MRTASRLLGHRGAGRVDLDARLAPVDGRLDQLHAAAVLVLDHKLEQRVDHRVLQQVRLEAEVLQLGALGVVVVLLGLDAVGAIWWLLW